MKWPQWPQCVIEQYMYRPIQVLQSQATQKNTSPFHLMIPVSKVQSVPVALSTYYWILQFGQRYLFSFSPHTSHAETTDMAKATNGQKAKNNQGQSKEVSVAFTFASAPSSLRLRLSLTWLNYIIVYFSGDGSRVVRFSERHSAKWTCALVQNRPLNITL
jgi:hypothetical protein